MKILKYTIILFLLTIELKGQSITFYKKSHQSGSNLLSIHTIITIDLTNSTVRINDESNYITNWKSYPIGSISIYNGEKLTWYLPNRTATYTNIYGNTEKFEIYNEEDILYKKDPFFEEIRLERKRTEEIEIARRTEELEKAKREVQRKLLYKLYLNTADSFLSENKFIEAKAMYQEAKEIYNCTEIILKISEMNEILNFIDERKTKFFNLKNLDPSTYQKNNSIIEDKLKDIFRNFNDCPEVRIQIVVFIDTLGNREDSILIDACSKNLEDSIRNSIVTMNFDTYKSHGFFINYFSRYDFKLKSNNYNYTLLKNNVSTDFVFNPQGLEYKLAISDIEVKSPIGEYSMEYYQRSINDTDFSFSKLISFSSIGGPSNTFLSILVPGLGVKYVSGNSLSGIKRTIFTYSLLSSSYLLKSYSNSQYQKYLEERDPLIYDQYYNKANKANKWSNGMMITGILYWIDDIIWVYKKGKENKNYQIQYFDKHKLTVEPATKFNGLTCIYTF